MLLWFVILYLMVSVGIGLLAATRVHSAKDYAVAGRSLPLPVVTATVFATWFGAEAVFGVSATFVKDGLTGVVADPFGSSLCLIIAGVLFSRYLYKLNILTLGDFYRMRYNRAVEVLTTLCIVASYLGWVAAQIKALGLIFYIVTDGAVSQQTGMILGAAIVLTYTTFGGMFSVAILDFVQMTVSMGGLLFIAWVVSGKVDGGTTAIVSHASAAGKLQFFPEMNLMKWVAFLGAWMTMMLGSIPQQDVFQRVTSAKSAKIALWGSLLGASIYFCFTFVPMFIAYSATLIDPALFARAAGGRHPAGAADAGAAAHAAGGAGAVLRRGAFGDHELLVGNAAGTLGHLRRERHQGLLAEDGRPSLFVGHARHADRLYRHGAGLRAQLGSLDLQDG